MKRAAAIALLGLAACYPHTGHRNTLGVSGLAHEADRACLRGSTQAWRVLATRMLERGDSLPPNAKEALLARRDLEDPCAASPPLGELLDTPHDSPKGTP